MFRIHRRGRPPHPGLFTPAEQRILPFLSDGLTNAEIAVRTGLSINTIHTHVANMLAKSGATDRRELASIDIGRGGVARLGGLALALMGAGGVTAVVAVAVALTVLVARGGGTSEAPQATADSALAAEVDAPGPFPPAATVRTVSRTTLSGEHRDMTVQIWYPAKPASAGAEVRPDFMAMIDAPVAAGPFPLLVFNSTYAGSGAPKQLSFLFSHLASHGVVVAGIAEPCAASPCGTPQNATVTWTADTKTVLDSLLALNDGADAAKYGVGGASANPDPVLKGLVDPTRIGMSGWGLGSITALSAITEDARFKTVLLLGFSDVPGRVDAARVTQPLMMFKGEESKIDSFASTAAFYAELPPATAGYWLVDIHRSNDSFISLSDCIQTQSVPPCSQIIDQASLNAIVKHWASAFLLVNLAGQAKYAPVLDPPSTPDKEYFVSRAKAGATPDAIPTLAPAHAVIRSGQTPTPPFLPSKPGTVLLDDPLTSSTGGRLPAASADTRYSAGYSDGQYVISEVAGAFNPAATPRAQAEVLVAGSYADASLAVDVALVSASDDEYVNMACRSQGEFSQYRLSMFPSSGQFAMNRWIDGTGAVLIPPRDSSAIHRGSAVNRVELSCHGTVIEAFINGTRVASVSDGAFGDGQFWIGMGQTSGLGGSVTPAGSTIEAHLNNLVVTQR